MTPRDALLRRALALSVLSIIIAGIAGSTAVIAALASGSLSLLGFGFDAAIDSAASMALVWRFLIEAREPHRAERVEKLAEATLGAILLVLALYLGVSAMRALVEEAHPDVTVVGTALLVVSVVLFVPLAAAKYRVARALRSRALRADSLLTGFAALLAVISLVSLGLAEAFGLVWADALGALLVTVILAREGLSSIQAIRTADRI